MLSCIAAWSKCPCHALPMCNHPQDEDGLLSICNNYRSGLIRLQSAKKAVVYSCMGVGSGGSRQPEKAGGCTCLHTSTEAAITTSYGAQP